MKRLFLLLLICPALTGCAVGPAQGLLDPKDKTCSVVFGYIDMTAAGGADLDAVHLARLDMQGPQIIQGYPDYPDCANGKSRRPGYFWVTDLPLGEYQLAEVVGRGHAGFSFDHEIKNASYIKITQPGVYYLGAFKIVVKGKSFEFRRIGSPLEQRALLRLLHRTRSSYWKPVIEQRLTQLGS